MNWKLVITANRRDEKEYYEDYERGVRVRNWKRYYLEGIDDHIKKILEVHSFFLFYKNKVYKNIFKAEKCLKC